MIAKVEPLTYARALRGPFDYLVPERLGAVGVGSVLVVPFGRRRALGVVVELAATSKLPVERLVEPLSALEADLPPELATLGLRVAEEYCSTPARGLALVLPPGTGAGERPRVRPLRRLVAILTEAGHDALAGAVRCGSRQREVLEALAAGARPAAALTSSKAASHSTLRSLERRGLIELTDRPVSRRRPARDPSPGARRARLTHHQEAALSAVVARLDAPPGADGRLLIHGVTGSGKTEVYLGAVEAVLARGRSAIVLVPEIALTPQTASRFRERFGDTVALLGSQLSEGERYDEWVRLRSGEARVCVGPRSAVFAPVEQLGLIVIDEEHDASYKQDGDPRYDARRVAELRAGTEGAVLVAGSATPRPETWHAYPRATMPERVDGSRLPDVRVLGMAGVEGPFHPKTADALQRLAADEGKGIVLLNRRGWSNYLACRSCGRAWQCPRCDVTLVLHRAAGRVSCHHCGHSEPVPEACPDCGSVSVARHGLGTESLERELRRIASPLPIVRLDSDTGARREETGKILASFRELPAGILVGTQMVAKGHDFPGVELGVVIDADGTLRFPDFRAEERTFALVAQLAGRTGRGGARGRVLVQSRDPSARALRFAAQHDAAGFLEDELARREALSYPPCSHLIRVVCASGDSGREREAADRIVALVTAARQSGLQVAGPAPLFRLRDRDRAQIMFKASRRGQAIGAVRAAVEQVADEAPAGQLVVSVDVDPH